MKRLRTAVIVCAALWLGVRWLQSYALYHFVALLERDAHNAFNYGVFLLVPVTLLGGAYLVLEWLRRLRLPKDRNYELRREIKRRMRQ